MTPSNPSMETGSFNAPSSPESMQNDDDNRDRCNLSLFSRNRSVRMGTSERLELYGASTGTLCQPLNEQGGPTNTQHLIPSSCSWKHKLGTFAIIILIVGSILLCTAVGTLAFLWFGNPDIPTWKETTARDWLSKAISICIGVIQQAMMLQLGVATATIASLALESGKVVIGDVASVSVMRATASSAGAFIMAWENLSRGKYRGARHSRIFLLVYSAATLWCLSQFLMLILLTDVSIRSTAGLVSTIDLPYSLHFIDMENGSFIGSSQFIEQSAGAWYRKLSQYASFAEYTEPSYEADGISDTGVTLRAFLPFRTAQERENLKSYKGKATVLDARVSCQVPQFRNATLGYDRGSFRLQGSLAPTRNTPRLTSATLDINNTAGSIDLPQDRWRDFDCLLDLHFGQPGTPTQESPVTLCQLWQSEHGDQNWGGLVSEFFDPPQMESEEVPVYAKPYLVLNQTMDYGPGFLYRDSQAYDSYERGEWKDMHYHEPDLAISASLCYAAFDFADIDVHISSKSNRTESRLEPVFDRETSTYNFAELRYAMGQDPSLLPDRRGILELEKQQWQAVPRENYTEYTALSWLFRSVTDLASKTSYNSTGAMSSYGTCTDCAQIEVMHQWLFQEILRTNGSIAFALQTMITILSSMAYYDQIGQFDKWTQAELSFFKSAQVPVGCAGFTVVVLTVTFHCILMAYCVSLFLRNTTWSRLGASWSAVAQVATGDVLGYLKHATEAGDNDFQARLNADGLESSKVLMKEVGGEISICISAKDKEK